MNEQKTTVDWLRFRAQSEPRDILETLRPMYGDFGQYLRLDFKAKGILGFQQSAAICVADMPIGRMDYGGESQRGWVRVDISGKGCQWVRDWDQSENLQKLANSEIRRLDIALTTWDGQITHDKVVQAHAAGRFITRRPPAMRQIISTDPRAGKTCEIGKREKSDKFMRCYEKGFEIESKSGSLITAIDGHKVEDIYRCEVEFKAVTVDIPWDCIDQRDHYFSGAYPFCADVLPNVEGDFMMRRPQREPQIDLAVALENCRVQFGPTLYTALACYGGDIGALFEKVMGDHHNQALIEAGVLLVDH